MSKEKKVTEAETSGLSIEQLEREMNRLKHQRNYRRTLTSTISVLITVAALTVLISMLVMPVLQIVGESMTPSITNGEIVVALKGSGFEKGEIIAFYYNNKILVKRVIASAGEWVNIDENGNVFINGTPLNEPYLVEKAYGDTNIELPYQVPDGKIFVMGDHRATSADSRNTAVGCVSDEQIVGKVLFRIWPFDKIGMIH
ncbi:MAG: signal peptidase I [Clostridia bacterium]|nr:signal peptidase I [Clostridia bacterium]